MNMKLVTGNTLETSVEASDDRALYAGIVGTGDYVFKVGQRFAHQIAGYGTVRILDGEGIMQGAHFIIPNGKYDDIEIDACVEGFKRIDLICARYRKFQNMETVELVVVKGVETARTPQVPEVSVGSILEDTSEHNMPLKKVTVQGSAIIGIENVFEEIPSISELRETDWIPLNLINGAKIATINGQTSVAEYKKEGKHVIVRGEIACTIPTSGAFQFATLPEGYRPKKLEYAKSVCSGVCMVRLLVGTGGGLNVEWIYNITNGSRFSGDIPWVTINIDFYVD